MNDEESGRVWAPWRIHYILGDKNQTCPFCEAPALGATPESLVLALQPEAFVILNRYPYTGCHLMVVPRRHAADLSDLTDSEYHAMTSLLRASHERLKAACNPHGVNVGMNLGEAAGAGIASHLHMHLVPRWRGDTNFMPVTAGINVVSQGVEHAFALLRPHFQDLDAG